jgi:hypothetical protein
MQDDSSDNNNDESIDSMVQQLLKSKKRRADGAKAGIAFEAKERQFEAGERRRNKVQRCNESNRCAEEGAADSLPSDNGETSKAPRASRNEERGVL